LCTLAQGQHSIFLKQAPVTRPAVIHLAMSSPVEMLKAELEAEIKMLEGQTRRLETATEVRCPKKRWIMQLLFHFSQLCIAACSVSAASSCQRFACDACGSLRAVGEWLC
jgi:hypothetical protein